MAGEIKLLADPHGIIAKIRARMSRDCAVRRSPYCDHVIAKRLQGISYTKIRDWLWDQNPDLAIPVPTLARNLAKAVKLSEMDQSVAEQIAEMWGGSLEFDLERTIAGQALVQRQRIDDMVKAEKERKKVKSGYMNPRIRQEMETLSSLLAQLERIKGARDKEEAGKEILTGKEVEESEIGKITMDKDGEQALTELILQGRLKIVLPIPPGNSSKVLPFVLRK